VCGEVGCGASRVLCSSSGGLVAGFLKSAEGLLDGMGEGDWAMGS